MWILILAPRSQAPLGNAPPRSSASHFPATTALCIPQLRAKQRFPDMRSQAELGNEVITSIRRRVGRV